MTNELRKNKMNERQKKAIEYLKEHNKITNREYQELNNVSNKTAYQDLYDMLRKNIIEKVGGGKHIYYILKVMQENVDDYAKRFGKVRQDKVKGIKDIKDIKEVKNGNEK